MIRIHSKDSDISGNLKLIVNASSITEFTLIDDKDDDLTQEELIKYVNLPVENKFVNASNGIVTGVHQLADDIWCKIKFRRDGEYTFNILLENDDTVIYTQSEKDRNTNFTYVRSKQIKDSTDGNCEVIVKGLGLFLSQAGGNTYTLKVECNGEDKVTCRTKVLTKRMLFYADIKMKNSDGSGFLSSINNDLSNLVDIYKSNHIELIKSFDSTVEYMPNIDTFLEYEFMTNVEVAYFNNPDNKHLDPYCLAITYVGQLALKDNLELFVYDIAVGPGEEPVAIDITNDYIRYIPLWHRINYPDDLNKNEWYVECTYTMLDDDDTQTIPPNEPVPIPKEMCTISSVEDNPDNCSIVHIDVSNIPSGFADISLTVNTVRMMRGGLTFAGTNIVCLCTKGWWEVTSAITQNSSIVHEVGHALGMVTDGIDASPDKGIYYYQDRGHVGPHCHSGICPSITTDYTPENHAEANCVMYGAIGPTRSEFCDDCSSKVKKLDLTEGITV